MFPLVWYLFTFIVLIYFPIAVMQFAGIVSNIHEKFFADGSVMPEPVSGRRVIVEITTNGQNPDVVDSIIGKIRTYDLSPDIFVVKEEVDLHRYAANEITVPAGYQTPKGSRTKLRALQYAINSLHSMGYGKEDYICHLDDDSIVERANKTMRESMLPLVLTDYEQAKSEIFRIIEQYNNKRRHSSLNFLTPKQYYRGNPEELLRIRESKIERARVLRRETNMKERNGGERAGTVS